MEGTRRGVYQAGQREIGKPSSIFGSTGHCRAALRCLASPTTKVALRDGGHWSSCGGQVARDEAGNVVGKGDLQQQIEQVGKNVGACLEAGGATVKDIVFTVSFVKDPAEFDKYADLRLRYFGPPSPDSRIVPMPQSTNSDLLVQVEAFAKTE